MCSVSTWFSYDIGSTYPRSCQIFSSAKQSQMETLKNVLGSWETICLSLHLLASSGGRRKQRCCKQPWLAESLKLELPSSTLEGLSGDFLAVLNEGVYNLVGTHWLYPETLVSSIEAPPGWTLVRSLWSWLAHTGPAGSSLRISTYK